jgi:thiol-disulfide isomerase/thioredoxin
MKKILYSLAFLALAVACGPDTVTVEGTIAEGASFPADQFVYLTDGDNVLDSTAVADGKFTLKAPANPEKVYSIVANFRNRLSRDRNWLYGLIAEKGTSNIVFAPSSTDCTISGSKINDAMTALNEGITALNANYRAKVSVLTNDEEEKAEALYNDMMAKIKDLCVKAIDDNKDNYIAKYALQRIIYDLPLEELDGILAKCGKFIREDEQIARIRNCKVAEIETAEGKPFVNFTGKTPLGDEVWLSDFVGKGKWVLADFWASWCGPCMREVPNIKKTHDTLSGDKFTVLGVAVWDGDNSASSQRMMEMGMTWPQIYVGEDNAPTDMYGITSIPTMILFAPDGTIYKRGEGLRGAGMMETIRAIINQ